MNQPNIILFMVDQLTSFVLNIYGGKVCRTPHTELLAQRGMGFKKTLFYPAIQVPMIIAHLQYQARRVFY
ncbi:MAG: hypothetical protein V3U65_09840 [Granulosicoccaceae bacterium]